MCREKNNFIWIMDGCVSFIFTKIYQRVPDLVCLNFLVKTLMTPSSELNSYIYIYI